MLTKSCPTAKLALFLCAGLLVSCTTYSGSADNPIERSLTWFSYVAGDDIKASCAAGSRDHFRFVYNAVYQKQIRAYDMKGVDAGADLVARVRNEPGNVSGFRIQDPLGPWALAESRASISNEQASDIVDALSRDAERAPASAGQQLASNEFYWIVSGCSAGSFRIWAFDQDRVGVNALEFASELRALDGTDIDFRNAMPVEGFDDGVFYIKINQTGDGTVRGF